MEDIRKELEELERQIGTKQKGFCSKEEEDGICRSRKKQESLPLAFFMTQTLPVTSDGRMRV